MRDDEYRARRAFPRARHARERPRLEPTKSLTNHDSRTQLIDILVEHFTKDAYPSKERMEELAAELGAPDYKKIESFYVNMRLKHQETFQ